jgi:hypothetical protein
MTAPIAPSPRAEQLLRALLMEVRGLRLALERTGAIDCGTTHDALLTNVRALLGEDKWTSEILIQVAHGDGADAAAVRHALAELGVCDPFALGMYLRGRVGRSTWGLELRGVGMTKNKVARWSVTVA